jgi:PAT family beta-lactamase induction signal transducer AmpG
MRSRSFVWVRRQSSTGRETRNSKEPVIADPFDRNRCGETSSGPQGGGDIWSSAWEDAGREIIRHESAFGVRARFGGKELQSIFAVELDTNETLLLNGVVIRPNASRADPGQSAGAKSVACTPWFWIPTLYLTEGIPFAIVTGVSVVLYKNLGYSNDEIAFYTSWLALPWVLKPVWSPVVDMLKTRRLWIWLIQLIVGAGFAAVALTLPAQHFLQYSLALFFLLGFSSATHDIAADGFYMLALTEREQSFFSGIRNTFFRVAMICGQGLLVMLAGEIQARTGNTVLAWQTAFMVATGVFIVFSIYHRLILPRPPNDRPGDIHSAARFVQEFIATFGTFLQKPKIGVMLLFLLFYRFAEAQLVKMVSPFLLDARSAGGLGLTTRQVGLVYGTIGVIALLLGGIAGGVLVSRRGLRAWLWPMVFIMHVPDAMFVYLSYAQPENLRTIGVCVALEQFGYGFGFTAYMLYMIYIALGQHQTAHYAICTGFMALGLMVPGMWSGRLQEMLGYPHFFMWVLVATIPGFIVTALIPLEAEFGKKRAIG